MTKVEYDSMVEELKTGRLLYDGDVLDVNKNIIAIVVKQVMINIDTSKVDTHLDVMEAIVLANKLHNEYYMDDASHYAILSNYGWLNKIIKTLADVSIIFPTYEEVKTDGTEDYVKSILTNTYDIFLNILKEKLNHVKWYITSRVHVELRDNVITGSDGSFLDLADPVVRYDNDRDKLTRVVYVGDEVTMTYVLGRRGHSARTVTVSNMIRVYIAFAIALNHNLTHYGLAIGNRDLIDTNLIMDILKQGEGMSGIKHHIDQLTVNIILIAGSTRDSQLGYIRAEQLRDFKGDYLIRHTSKVDISKIDPHVGLLLLIMENNVTVQIKDRYDVYHLILDINLIDCKFTGHLDMAIDNLAMGEKVRLLDIIRTELGHLGLLDLYSQPPEVIEQDIEEFFMGGRCKIYINNVPAKGELSYFTSHDTIYIGKAEGSIFKTTVLGGIYDNRLPDHIIRFNTLPNVRKVTKHTKSELRRFLNDTHYNMFKGLIDL